MALRRFSLPGIDLALVLGLVGVVLALVDVQRQWTADLRPAVVIDLSLTALPGYTLLSLVRGLAAYGLSLGFALVYGYWAAKHRPSGRVLVPLLDVLQSIPVLGFMPGLVLGLISIFPGSNVGLELAAVLMIFTGQAWNMAFSFYASLTSLPRDQVEAASSFRFTAWMRLRRVELPFATTGLVWNSMMSMAGGWFFLMLAESFTLGARDFRLPGVGSYMSEAMARDDRGAMVAGVVAMILMIVALDQFLWRPLVVWSERFRIEESAGAVVQTSWVLTRLRRSRLLHRLMIWWRARRRQRRAAAPSLAVAAPADIGLVERLAPVIAMVACVVLVVALCAGGWHLVMLVASVPWQPVAGRVSWTEVLGGTGFTALRVFGTLVLGTAWALPAGLAIGRSPRGARLLQPLVQVAASFPAPMLFPLLLLVFQLVGLPLGIGAMVLMLMGTQWYILFNVIAGAQAIPSDLKEAAASFRLSPWRRFWTLEAPAVLPALLTGWVTAAGGAWNASIVAEYLTWHEVVHATDGLGATISRATAAGDYRGLAAAVAVMAVVVVAINHVLWHPLQRFARQRFALDK